MRPNFPNFLANLPNYFDIMPPSPHIEIVRKFAVFAKSEDIPKHMPFRDFVGVESLAGNFADNLPVACTFCDSIRSYCTYASLSLFVAKFIGFG